MSKLFIEVKTPGNGKKYEFQLDSTMTVRQAKAKMIDEITELENGNITLKQERTILCNLSTRLRICEDDTLKNAGVKSGQGLLLV